MFKAFAGVEDHDQSLAVVFQHQVPHDLEAVTPSKAPLWSVITPPEQEQRPTAPKPCLKVFLLFLCGG